MLKPTSLLTHVFKNNKKSQEKLFNNMRNFGSWVVWRNGIRAISSYLDVETITYQYCMLNPTPLDWISGYIMSYDVGDRYLKRLPKRRLNLTGISISSYWYIINSPELLDIIKQENKLASVIGDIETDHFGAK